MSSRSSRLLREPLVHFLLLGLALFVSWRLLGKGPASGEERIEVTAAEVEGLVESWTGVWQRAPDADELRRLVDDYVREEILVREALRLGLERADPVIRRRLREKMELLGEDVSAIEAPSEAELEAFLAQNPELFEREARISFRHVYLDAARRDAVGAQAAAVLERLRSEPEMDVTQLGDAVPLPRQVGLMRASEIRRLFGGRFVEALAALQEGRWEGPIESNLGVHLVRIDGREESRRPALMEVRREVEREWLAARRKSARDQRYEALRRGYDVEVIDLESFLQQRTAASSESPPGS